VAATFVPITPTVLEWAINEAGVDPAQVAEKAGVEPDAVLGWIAGEVQPTKTQFGRVMQFLKRPAPFFFLAEPPVEAQVPASFRHAPGGARDATKTELEAVRRARRVQRIAKWTAERVGDERWALEPIPPADGASPADAAEVARERLGWLVPVHQQGAPSSSAVVKLIRAAVEERGVVALQLSIGPDGCRGFSLYDDLKPVIAINTHYNAEARLFTYLHEVGHLMRRTDAICVGAGDTAAERWCERFAAAFLLPRAELRERLERRFGAETTVRGLDQVRLLARDFRVSQTAMAIRLEDLGWGASGLVGLIPRATDFKSGGGGGADNTRGATRLRELGAGYFSLLLEAESSGTLGRQDVLRYLDVSETQLRAMTFEAEGPSES